MGTVKGELHRLVFKGLRLVYDEIRSHATNSSLRCRVRPENPRDCTLSAAQSPECRENVEEVAGLRQALRPAICLAFYNHAVQALRQANSSWS